jgi:hypothetical protein
MQSTIKTPVVVYIQDSQSPEEKQLGLNLMMNTLSQTKNSKGEASLPTQVQQIAELLIMINENRLPTRQQMIKLMEEYPHDDISPEKKQTIIAKLSESVFDESPVKGTPPRTRSKVGTPSARRQDDDQDESGTESDDEPRPARSGKVIHAQTTSHGEFVEMMEDLLRSSQSAEQAQERDEELLAKYKAILHKMDKGHIIAMVLNLVNPKTAQDDQGRALQSIYASIDAKTQLLVVLPMTQDTECRNRVQHLQGSIALSCLIKHIFGQDHSAIKKQLRSIGNHGKKLSELTTAQEFTKFKREHLSEIAVYEKLWKFYATPGDQKETEHAMCKTLLKDVVPLNMELAMQLLRQLDDSKASLTMDQLLAKLEEYARLRESLEADSPAKSKEKDGSTKSSDKKGTKQPSASPAIQQPVKCTSCGNEHDISQCPKEKARLQREAQQRGERLPGNQQSTRRDNLQSSQNSNAASAGEDNYGCYFCYALGRNYWTNHHHSKCKNKKQFYTKLSDAEHCDTLLQRIATKPRSNDQGQSFERTNVSRNHGQAQRSQGQVPHAQHLQQMQLQQMLQLQQQGPALNFPQGHHMQQMQLQANSYPANPSHPVEHVQPWQLQSTMQNGQGLFNSSHGSNGLRSANMSQAMMPGNAAESSQMPFFDPRIGPPPIVLQVSPQSQGVRQRILNIWLHLNKE